MVNTYNELRLVKWIGQFGEIVDHYPKKNPTDKKAEEKYEPLYKNSGNLI
ncbi:Hypothetical protein FKW44_012825 [Caligus rogercresseyi]|uniref:Uncharacterized protein n=1 Tax=Caligus rogercresseyi TaxID=217165 RepID=A0A7T8HJW9_CALRO|nr:Hypothetical protein FKW44_012825 [Caligus rogercresseyi]